MITVVCEKTRMIWVVPTAPKRALVRFICFVLTISNNEQHPYRYVIFNKYGALANSTDVTNLLVDYFRTVMETTGGDASWLNGKNEWHNRIILNMVISGLLDRNQQGKKWCCVEETSAELYRWKIHSALDNISPNFSWYGINPSINEIRTIGCDCWNYTRRVRSIVRINAMFIGRPVFWSV